MFVEYVLTNLKGFDGGEYIRFLVLAWLDSDLEYRYPAGQRWETPLCKFGSRVRSYNVGWHLEVSRTVIIYISW